MDANETRGGRKVMRLAVAYLNRNVLMGQSAAAALPGVHGSVVGVGGKEAGRTESWCDH